MEYNYMQLTRIETFGNEAQLNSNILVHYIANRGFMVVNATFNNISVISWRSVLRVVEMESLINIVESHTHRLTGIRTSNFSGDRH